MAILLHSIALFDSSYLPNLLSTRANLCLHLRTTFVDIGGVF